MKTRKAKLTAVFWLIVNAMNDNIGDFKAAEELAYDMVQEKTGQRSISILSGDKLKEVIEYLIKRTKIDPLKINVTGRKARQASPQASGFRTYLENRGIFLPSKRQLEMLDRTAGEIDLSIFTTMTLIGQGIPGRPNRKSTGDTFFFSATEYLDSKTVQNIIEAAKSMKARGGWVDKYTYADLQEGTTH